MFNQLIGNEPVKHALKRLLARGRVCNSLLFCGEEGVGKKLFALETAKSFVCREPIDGEACGTCSACRRADVFVFPKSEKGEDYDRVFFSEHPDVGMVIPFRRNLRVGAIRELEREANFRPYEARARFFIVDDADKMNDAAANALLKTLEEPPADTYIILVTSRPDSLLPTIRSRCQTIRFAPVAISEIEEFLVAKQAFSRDEARLAARSSGGSIGRAFSLNVEQFRGARGKMLDVIRAALVSGDRASILKISEEMNDAKNKENFEENLDILESLIHDTWSLCASGDADGLVNADIAEDLQGLARMASRPNLSLWLSEIETMRSNFIVNINRRIATDALFVTMSGS